MDWLASRQEAIEKKLAAKHLGKEANPDRLALFDLSSSKAPGTHCLLAARGYSRDGKKGLPQVEYGLLTDPGGRPVAVRVVGRHRHTSALARGLPQPRSRMDQRKRHRARR